MVKWLLAGVIAAALLLLAGCGADTRHEIYRVHAGQNGDWTLEVRRWVEFNNSVLLPEDLKPDESRLYTRTYWKIEYHGDKAVDELSITKLEVSGENWSQSLEIAEEEYLSFDTENSWGNDNSYTYGINVGDSEACYALLTDTDGNTIRIDAPLVKSKGNKM